MANDKKTFLTRFKEFVNRGNVVDMAVGVIVGGAFSKIVTSLVNDIINPPLGLLLGGMNLAELKLVLRAAVPEVLLEDGTVATAALPEVAIAYGAFLQQILDFIIIALCVFCFVNLLTQLRELSQKKEKEAAEKAAAEAAAAKAAEPPKPTQEELLTEIRDLLKARK